MKKAILFLSLLIGVRFSYGAFSEKSISGSQATWKQAEAEIFAHIGTNDATIYPKPLGIENTDYIRDVSLGEEASRISGNSARWRSWGSATMGTIRHRKVAHIKRTIPLFLATYIEQPYESSSPPISRLL